MNWFGGTTPWNQPDPLIWWFATPVVAYLVALWLAIVVSWVINSTAKD